MTLRFSIPGKPISNNRNIRNFGRATKNAEATEYQERVASRALAAVKLSGWTYQPCVSVTIVHWNGIIDCDNVPKVLCDALRGVVYVDDSRKYVRNVNVWAYADGGPEYVEITVTSCEPLPTIRIRKCSVCLAIRGGTDDKPHLCGLCAQTQKATA